MTSRHWTSRKGVTAFVVGSRHTSWRVRVPKFGRFPFAALSSLIVFFLRELGASSLCCEVRLFSCAEMG